jgi:hypothetical protein
MYGCSRKGDESIINLPWPGGDSLTGSVYVIEECREAEVGGISHFLIRRIRLASKNEDLRRSQSQEFALLRLRSWH